MENEKINNALVANISLLSDFANRTGHKDISIAAKNIIYDVHKQCFSVAVVGEFSRGKSSLINKILGKEVLPVGDLPTTAMLTSIKYDENNNIRILKNNNEQVGEYNHCEDVWNQISDNKTTDELTEEKAVVTMNIPWLQENGIAILDTPGAGDLEESRAKVIGDALLSCDGAIITIAATSPFSMSEKLFIEQRLIAHQVPFLMIVITKLDLVKENERSGVINYIQSKLKTLKTDLPIFIADEDCKIEDFDINCVGIDKIKEQIVEWKNNPERIKLTEKSMASKAFSLLNILKEALKEKKALVDKDDYAIKKAIEDKKMQIMQTGLVWENLRLELNGKADECVDFLFKRISVYKDNLIESLRVSLYQTDDLKKWASSVYPNTTRLELTKIATDLNSDLKKRIAKDRQWFYEELDKQVKVKINKDIDFRNNSIENNNIKSLNSFDKNFGNSEISETYENLSAIALFIGFNIFSPISFPVLITVLGSKLVARYFFNKIRAKSDVKADRDKLWKAILEEIPIVLNNATSSTRDRIKAVYKELANESEKQEKLWKNTQEQIISELSNKVNTNGVDTYVDIIDFVKLSTQFKAFFCEK